MRHNQKLFDYSHFRYPKDIANFASFELFKHSEVPAWIHNYHVGMLKALRHENMYLKEGSDSQEKVPFLLKTRKLVSEEAKYVAGRFTGFKNVNFEGRAWLALQKFCLFQKIIPKTRITDHL